MLVTCIKCNNHVETGDAAAGDVVKCACGISILVPEGPAAAGKMNCPACGAPVDPATRLCEFCSTRLATEICPSCFGMVFKGTRFCKHCGDSLENRAPVHHGDRTKLQCPRCEAHPTMRVEVVSACPLCRCPECEGLWVDARMVEKIYQEREKAPAIDPQIKPRTNSQTSVPITDAPAGNLGATVAYIKCPECQKMMNRKNFGRCSGVIIDLCKDHGTWFDADELQRILVFIQSGGLEKAAERERLELKEELKWLKRKQKMQESTEGMSAHFGMAPGGPLAGARSGRLLSESVALSIGGMLRKFFR